MPQGKQSSFCDNEGGPGVWEGPADLDWLDRDSLSGEARFEPLLKDMKGPAVQRSGVLQMLRDPLV